MNVTMILIVIGASGKITKGSLKGLEDMEVGGRNHPKYSIIENGQNTEKSLGDSRRFAVAQTPVKDHLITLLWEKLKEIIVIINKKLKELLSRLPTL